MAKPSAYRNRIEVLQGTLDLIVLQTLQWGPRHGYGIARAIQAGSGELLKVDTGSLYPALHRLERQRWIAAGWKISENKQRVRVYRLTASGKRQLARAALLVGAAVGGDRVDPGAAARAGRAVSLRLPLFRRRRDQELREEIEGHLAEAVRERIERGEPRDEAEAAARRELGNALLVREVTRDTWGFGFLDELVQDASYALRVFRRNPAFSFVAVLTLALGIGANVAIFDVVHAVLLRPLPLLEDERLVIIGPEWRGSVGSVAPADFLDLRRQNTVFAGITAVRTVNLDLREGEQPERREGVIVTPEFFDVVGVKPRLGRGFLPDEQGSGRDHVVVISDSLWRSAARREPGRPGAPAAAQQRALHRDRRGAAGVPFPGGCRALGAAALRRARSGSGRSRTRRGTVARTTSKLTRASSPA